MAQAYAFSCLTPSDVLQDSFGFVEFFAGPAGTPANKGP